MSSSVQPSKDDNHPDSASWHGEARAMINPATPRSNKATQMAKHTRNNIKDKLSAKHAKNGCRFLLSSAYYHIFLSIFLFKSFFGGHN